MPGGPPSSILCPTPALATCRRRAQRCHGKDGASAQLLGGIEHLRAQGHVALVIWITRMLPCSLFVSIIPICPTGLMVQLAEVRAVRELPWEVEEEDSEVRRLCYVVRRERYCKGAWDA